MAGAGKLAPALPMLNRGLMTIPIATLPIALCLEIWLAVLLYRRQAYKLAPVSFSYIVISVPVSLVRVLTVNHYHVYFYVYWASELLLILLSLSALIRSSGTRTGDLTRSGGCARSTTEQSWWPWASQSGWPLSPPVLNRPIISFMLDAEITANMVRGGIVALFAALVKPMVVRFQRILRHHSWVRRVQCRPQHRLFCISAFGTKVTGFKDIMTSVSYLSRW